MTPSRSRTSLRGFTLPEILVSVSLSCIVSVFAFQIFRIDHKVFAEQEEVVDMQQNARVAYDQILRDLRLAGAEVPKGGVDSEVGYLYPVVPGNGGGQLPDTLKVFASFDNVRTRLSSGMPNESAELKVVDASNFDVGAIALIAGPVEEGGWGAEVFHITHISTEGQDMIQHRRSPPWNEDQKLNHTYLPQSRVSMMTYRKYFIDNSDASHPALMVSDNEEAAAVLADNIENLQVVYDLASGERDIASPEDPATIRKATVTIVARTNTMDSLWNNGTNSITGEPDNFRRMTLRSDVQMRNLEE
jgi:prepilin-type N-terminal cleavage/methylation domain-containing protein